MVFDDQTPFDEIPRIGEATIEDIAEAYPETVAELRPLDPVQTAVMFGSLLTKPELQPNCFRIEALVHLAVTCCEGSATPETSCVARQFGRLGEGYCGKMEDPSEDVYITLVNTPRGNFRVFEGLLDGAGFYLQRILNVVESMPDVSPFDRIRSAVAAMLRLSDSVVARAGLQENDLGNELPHRVLPSDVAEELPIAGKTVRFDACELAELQVTEEALTEFVFDPDRRLQLLGQTIGHTDLERYPITIDDGLLYLLLPTAVAPAIIRFVIESVMATRKAGVFENVLCQEYSRLFNSQSILGKRLPGPIKFECIQGGYIAAAMTEVDAGRFLHLVFFVDAIDGFVENGLNGLNAQSDALPEALELQIRRASSGAKTETGFRSGISLLICCGFGRAFGLKLTDELPGLWRLEAVTAHDLITLNWVDEFTALSLWRLLDARQTMEEAGVDLLNVNGLLNLVAWSRQLGGNLVPHGELPDGFADLGTRGLVIVPQNAIRELRHRVIQQWNPRRVVDSNGCWVRVLKLDKGEFDEDNLAPLFGSEDDVKQGRLRGVYVAARRPWWIGISAPEGSPRKAVYERFMMLCTWLRRAAPILDQSYEELPPGPIECAVAFAEIVGATHSPVKPMGTDELRTLIETSTARGSARIEIRVAQGFDDGLAQPENVAERALVTAFVEAVAEAADGQIDKCKEDRLVSQICPDSDARWAHRFEARTYRDFVRSERESHPVLINELDGAAPRIGLGWRVRSRDNSPEITGESNCTSYLNDVVRVALDDLCASLRTLDRRRFVSAALENHEATASDRDVWKQTARAILAMHDDKAMAMGTIVKHHLRLNASFLATRILLEAAICECPLEGGNSPGELDLTRAMAQVVFAHNVGGWSDAIHWRAMEPRVRVTPLGDVHVNHSYVENIYEPFGRTVAEAEVRRAVESYDRLYARANEAQSLAGLFEGRFLDAWEAEFRAPLDGIRSFVDKLDGIGLQPPRLVLDLPRSVLIAVFSEAAQIPPTTAAASLRILTLVPRPKWRAVSDGFTDKDWFPWRLRRRLSVLRRPFIQLNEEDDPTIVFAPALVRDALYAMVRWFHSGEVPSAHSASTDMRKWIGHANNVQRTEFNSTVACRMRELGWHVEPQVRLTKILGRSLERDYGDIDVLAWRPNSDRVLAIECKDLQYNRTLGQVAEQLADFLGEARADGKPDHLKKHLDRLEVLNANKVDVVKMLKLDTPIQIEGHLVFKNPVPMRFAWDRMASRIKLSLFDDLDKI